MRYSIFFQLGFSTMCYSSNVTSANCGFDRNPLKICIEQLSSDDQCLKKITSTTTSFWALSAFSRSNHQTFTKQNTNSPLPIILVYFRWCIRLVLSMVLTAIYKIQSTSRNADQLRRDFLRRKYHH